MNLLLGEESAQPKLPPGPGRGKGVAYDLPVVLDLGEVTGRTLQLSMGAGYSLWPKIEAKTKLMPALLPMTM